MHINNINKYNNKYNNYFTLEELQKEIEIERELEKQRELEKIEEIDTNCGYVFLTDLLNLTVPLFSIIGTILMICFII